MFLKLGWLTVLALTFSCLMRASANIGQEVGATATDTGFDLPRLKTLDAPALTPAKKAQRGLSFYRVELEHPTPRLLPPYTDFKTHDYVLARITRKLGESGADLEALRKAREKAAPGELRDCLTLVLLDSAPQQRGDTAKSGKSEQPAEAEAARADREKLRDEVIAYVRDVKHPLRLRELAAEVLGVYAVREKDASVGEPLAELAQRDPHSCYKGGPDGKPVAMLFPVKRAAIEAIKKMQKAKLPLPSYVTRVINVPVEQPLRTGVATGR